MSSVRAKVIQEANEFAERQGMVAIAVSAEENRPAMGFPSFAYQFRLVPRGSRAALEPGKDFEVVHHDNSAAAAQAIVNAAAVQRASVPQPARVYQTNGDTQISELKMNIDSGKALMLIDGSVWGVQSLDRLACNLWMRGSRIIIADAKDGIGGFDNLLINVDEGSRVHAKLLTR